MVKSQTLRVKSRLGLLQVLIQIIFRLILLKHSRHAVQTACHQLFELLVAHLDHVFHIHNLYRKQTQQGQSHHNGE